MQVRIYNAESGSIDRHPVTDASVAKDLSRCLVAMTSSGVYRVQLVDPMRGDLVLWDTYDDLKVAV